MIDFIEKKSNEVFRHYLDSLSEAKLLEKLTQTFVDKSNNEFTVLSYLIQKARKDVNEKFEYSLKKLSEVKDFDLPQYLNLYRVSNNVMKDTPMYLLAILYQQPSIMQSLYDYGTSPNATMLSEQGLVLDADMLSIAISTSGKKTVAEKHDEIKARYLESKLSQSLKDKPSQKMVKL